MIARQSKKQQGISLAAIALMMVLAQSNLIDVYADHMMWIAAAIPSTALGTAIAFAGTRYSLTIWWQLTFSDVDPIHHRPSHSTAFHHHRSRDTRPGYLEPGMGDDVRSIQISHFGGTAGRHRIWQSDGRMDYRIMAGVPGRHVRHQ